MPFSEPNSHRSRTETVRNEGAFSVKRERATVMLVEKHAKEAGLGNVTAAFTPLGSPSAVNDALLSGSAEFAAAGIPPFLILWDKTRKSADMRALAALNSQPAYLNTNKPDVKSLKDFTSSDR